MTLATIWFILVFVLLGGYAVLDGFDLGVGALHLLARDDRERRLAINAIGPVWDGNEVWLLTAGGALFAAFPAVYATVFSGFYLALMLVLAALMFRAVSIEFRGKVDSPRWRRWWDVAFGASSTLLPVLFGVALGNVLRGVPLAADGTADITFLGLLNPYAVLVGVLALAVCVMQGATYLTGKTTPDAGARAANLAIGAWVAVVVLFLLATVASLSAAPSLFRGTAGWFPVATGVALLVVATVVHPLALLARRWRLAFTASSSMTAAMIALAAAGLYPRLLPSRPVGEGLTLFNSASSHGTLVAMLVIALIGMPLVIAYTLVIHHVFRGRVVIGPDSY